ECGGVVLSGHAPRARLFMAKLECGSKAHRGHGIVWRRLANDYIEFARRKGERLYPRRRVHDAGRKVSACPGHRAGDIEQNASDLLVGQDYSTLTAIRAPLPTLEINNAEDNCCFRAALVKPYIYEAVRPFFRLYGKEEALQFHENTNISAHNYELDDRHQAYGFLAKY